jgi:hypothetical protein
MTQATWSYLGALSSDPIQLHLEERMKIRIGSMVLLAAMFALASSVSAFAQLPCGVANQLACQPWDGGANLFASQNDTNGNGNFATSYQQFTLAKGVSY